MGDETAADEVDEDAYIGVELKTSQSVVNVRKKRLMLITQYERYNKGGKGREEDKGREEKEEKRVTKLSRSRSKDAKKSKDKKRKKSKERKEKKLKWVLPGIVVRVVSKVVEDGKLYN